MTIQKTHQVDATGLSCPMPILRTAQAMTRLASGELLEVLATDPGSSRDFVAWARITGHALIEQSQEDGTYRFLLRRK